MRINSTQTNYFSGDAIFLSGLSALSGAVFTNTIYTAAISANGIISVSGGSSDNWNSTYASISTLNLDVYTHEVHVSQVDGDDVTGTGNILNPVKTITKALTLVGSARKTVIIHPGTYVENPNITVQYTVLSGPGIIGGNVVISGTVSTSTGCTIQGLKMTNLNITAPAASGNVNIINCDISGILTKSSAADYTLIRFCDIGTINITGAGLTAIFGGNPRLITVSNALASVVMKNAVAVRPIVTAGSINLVDCIVPAIASQWVSGKTYAAGNYVYNAAATYIRISSGAGATAPAADPANWAVVSALGSTDTRIAVTAAASTVVTLANSQIISPLSDDVAPVALNGFYSIFNCVYDKPESTLVTSSGTGGPTNSIDYFQYIDADQVTVSGAISSNDGITVSTATVRGSVSATGRVNTLGITQNIIPVVAGLSALNLTGNNGLSALVYTPPTGYKFIAGDYFITPTVKAGNYSGSGQNGGTFNLIDSDYNLLANSVSPATILNIDNVVKGTLTNTTRSTTTSGVWIVMTTAPNFGSTNTISVLSATVLVTGYLIPTTSSF